MITLTNHSRLNADGFLVIITRELAQHDISVNPVSAYYHDYLFMPVSMEHKARHVLKKLSNIPI